jgi:translocation protein SEC63
MASEYAYDEEGETWPFFIMALLCFILIPLTVRYVYRIISGGDANGNHKIVGAITEDYNSVDVPNKSHIKSFRSKQKSGKIFNKTLIILAVGWAAFAYVALYMTKEVNLKGAFDPYHILDVSMTASEKEIKSKYRKLSLQFHPDKLPKDLTPEKRQQLEDEFVIINAAYKSLTDEVTRNNFLKYGHPDGPQEVKHGIALPKYLVDSKYSSIIVVFYFLLIGGLLPWIVGSWWSNVKSHTKKGLHVDTAASFTRRLTDRNPGKVVTPFTILEWVLDSYEVKSAFPNKTEEQINELISLHFNRKYVPELENDKLKLISILPKLINGLNDIATVFRQTEVVLPAADLLKSVIAAVKPTGKYQDLLQLPFVDPEVVVKQDIKKLGKLMTLPKEEAKKVLGISSEKQLDIALNIAESIPTLRIVEAEFKVPGEDNVTPNSTAHLSLKFLVKSPKLKSCPKVDEKDLVDEETMEYLRNPYKVNEEQPQLPCSFAPYFPSLVRTKWSGFLINQKDNKLEENSTVGQLENIDLSNLKLTQEEWIKGDQTVIGTFKFAFPGTTPASLGTYPYRFVLKNNSYFGCDVDIPVFMEVKSVPVKPMNIIKKKAADSDEESDSESDISDPEEDGLASALKALQNMAEQKKAADNKADDDDDDDDASIFTDIDTETEDESEN